MKKRVLRVKGKGGKKNADRKRKGEKGGEGLPRQKPRRNSVQGGNLPVCLGRGKFHEGDLTKRGEEKKKSTTTPKVYEERILYQAWRRLTHGFPPEGGEKESLSFPESGKGEEKEDATRGKS